ncbi:unnamed protein product [Brachionus calyciflorus]|uniref:Uncharacterized protein n=1 Tax=Brachionus calyciflorus TaxID=104777 RepID=A0A814IF39_9BILA|nr:unnamed protein product [Brachionus calyciflorus]
MIDNFESELDLSSTSIIQRSSSNNPDDTDNEIDELIPTKKARGETKVYDFYKKYNNLQVWNKIFKYIHNICICYELKLLKFPTLDLNIKKNSKRSRRKKVLPALERNSTGPLNLHVFRPIQTNIEPNKTNKSSG